MHLSSLLSRANSLPHQIRNQSKEEFFAIKKSTKRLKISNIFSQPPQRVEENASHNHSSQTPNELSIDLKESKQELASTICSSHYLTFRSRQPKRKKNKQSHNNHDPNYQSESASENQSPSPITEAAAACGKTTMVNSQHISDNRFSADSFLFICKVGEGTYSQVFKAMEKRTGFICSLKTLNKEKMKALKMEQNVFREIKIHSFVNHPHITKLYGCFDDEKFIYLICEYATDENVYEHLCRNKAQGRLGLALDRVWLLVGQICSALNYMHSNFIIHRDIKPQNMILTYGETIKLCDFGWSIYNPEQEMRSTICGTPLYLAPELIKEVSYSEAVDVWALGVLTYQLLTSQIPFKIRSRKDLQKVVSTEIKFTKIKCRQAVDFIEKALKKDQEQRQSIFQLFGHPFLKHYHQQTKM